MTRSRGCCGGESRQAAARETVPEGAERVVDEVRERYGKIAGGTLAGCGAAGESAAALAIGYQESDLALLPEGANLGLGCGAPVEALGLLPGETVLDLGCGAGMDVFLAAREVGPSGRVIGVDMTPAMLEKARANAARAGFTAVEFREGRLERLPVEDGSIDAVTSNCVINLVPDKGRVFREVARVLKPGGRVVVSDIVLDAPLPEAVSKDLLAYVGCVAGAMLREAYFAAVGAAGLGGVEVLRDVDYLASSGTTFSPELLAALETAGVRSEDLVGTVRSVTFRATKPA